MKRIINNLLLLSLIVSAAGGCTKEPLVFEHEKPQFEINPNAILLEVLLPSSSTDDDEYYIVGDFNGGPDVAIGNATWRLQKASTGVAKWGIYLLPSTFVNGKTLADGFYFHSVKQGDERSARGEEVLHRLDVGVGTRTNVWVDQWDSYFFPPAPPKEITTIYVEKTADWPLTMLYMWSDTEADTEFFGAWPGGKATGERQFGDRVFYYWALDKAHLNKTVNFIFNNGNGGPGNQTSNIEGVRLEPIDMFYVVHGDANYERILPPEGDYVEMYNGYTVYVDDRTGWNDFVLYLEYNHAPLAGAFPGLRMVGTEEIEGVVWKVFQPGENLNNATMNFNFNDGLKIGYTEVMGPQNYVLDHDVFFTVTAEGWDTPFEGKGTPHSIYVEDNTGWERFNVYYWGSGSDPAWPGLAPTKEETIGGVTYKVFETPALHDGTTINLIFNDKVADSDAGTQYDVTTITLDRDFYFTAGPDSASEKVFKAYVDDRSGWADLALYAWGGYEFAGWPGLQSSGTETHNGVVFTVFDLPVEAIGKEENLIFNSNLAEGASQFNGPTLTLAAQDYWFRISDTAVHCTIYIDDQSGWDDLALYAWGGYEFAAWPGLQSSGTEIINSVTYTKFEIPVGAIGQTENLIFNNNLAEGATQFNGPTVIIGLDLYYRITDSSATAVTP